MSSTLKPSSGKSGSCRSRPSKLERVRQSLVDLLPTQEDTDLICSAGNCWVLLHSLSSRAANVLADNICTAGERSASFNIAEISKRHPTIIAQTLLYLAVCLQQLDPSFDTGRLHLYPSVEGRAERYLSTVHTLVTSDDEFASTMEGLE